MATLVLTAVGSAIGGPIGGAIGAIIGQQVDQNILFRPKGREGPRLQELAIQTSSYGAQIPRIFGRMRVAGTVIWATDLKETRSREGGGKGRPSTTIYSYSASFAVVLSSRRIESIGRIWADGKIFRGAAGDFKTEAGFAFYRGGEDQPVDGLMASAEAGGGTPAYRGLALAVFEDMDLTEYGNRIPSLTFELIADDGAVSFADLVADISGERIAMEPGDAVTGFAAGGEDRQAALRLLTDTMALSFSSDPGSLDRIGAAVRSVAEPGSGLALDGDFVCSAGQQDIAPPTRRTASISAVPRQLSIHYYDPARDYQSGVQSASRPGAGRMAIMRDFPAAMIADQARKMAADLLWSEYDERSTLHVSLPLDSRRYRPGMLAEFAGIAGLWRIRECEIGRGFVQLSLMRARQDRGLAEIESEEGRIVANPDQRAGVTRLMLADLPFAADAPTMVSDSGRLYAAAAGDTGWRNAQLFASGPDGEPGAYIGQIPAPAIIGKASGVLGAANPGLIDEINHLDVDLQNPAMTLAFADLPQLLAGTNIALLGGELLQFANAVPMGQGRFRLSRLIRGLGGTENEITGHDADEDFVLLDGASLLEIPPAHYAAFAPIVVFALGRDDPVPASAAIQSPGRALLPWSPVHPGWQFLDGGDLDIRWTRRSRAGATWSDHVEVPLAEETEKYRIQLSADGLPEATISRETPEPRIHFTAAEIQPMVTGNISALGVAIVQVGAFGQSPPLAFDITL